MGEVKKRDWTGFRWVGGTILWIITSFISPILATILALIYFAYWFDKKEVKDKEDYFFIGVLFIALLILIF